MSIEQKMESKPSEIVFRQVGKNIVRYSYNGIFMS